MTNSLEYHVREIWLKNIGDDPNRFVNLQTISDTIIEWERLLPPFYEQLGLNAFDNSRELSDALGVVSRLLTQARFYGAATHLLIDAWQKTGTIQRKTTHKIYRAGLAFYLSELYLQQADKGAAFWWQLLALADDYLEGSGGGGARIVLESILGVPKGKFFDSLQAIAIECRKACEQQEWIIQQGFAEDVVTKFAIKSPQYASMFAYPTNEVEFPLSPGYLETLLAEIDNDKQGKKLEHIACYLFIHIPGCTPTHNLLDEDQTMQTDVVIRNLTPQGNLVAETFGRHFIIECKNWTSGVGSPECGYFLHRIQLQHSSFGVMLAREGITGKDQPNDESAARQLIRRSFHEHNLTCIVISLHHLQRLADETISLRTMMFEEIERFRFGQSKTSG